MEYHICISYGVRKEFYRRFNEKQVGTWQGHVLSVNIYRDTSCLVFKRIEEENLEIQIIAPITKKEQQQVAVLYIEDTDMVIDREDA